MLRTDKMDQSNSDTYEVPLKGGIMSYNITSIRGAEVMHYFKRIFDKQSTTVKVDGKDYQLEMEDAEFKQFMDQFTAKVNNVITHCVNEFKQQNPKLELTKVSFYPVPSSSRFNDEMSKRMVHYRFAGLPSQVINPNLLKKDLKNLQRDEEFISKNQELYNMPIAQNGTAMQGTHGQWLDREVNKLNSSKNADKHIEAMNELCKKILNMKNNRKQFKDETRYASQLANLYAQYYDNMKSVTINTRYFNPVTNAESGQKFEKLAKALKYTKGHAVERRSGEIWATVQPYLKDSISNVTGKPYGPVEINYWQKENFQIKNLPNSTRMGMKGYYNPDDEVVKQEMEKIQGTVFVIFDDNVSGGATLSDICMQCKQLGINYLVPITFGAMAVKNQIGTIPLSTKDFNMS